MVFKYAICAHLIDKQTAFWSNPCLFCCKFHRKCFTSNEQCRRSSSLVVLCNVSWCCRPSFSVCLCLPPAWGNNDLSRDALFMKDDGVISAFLGCVVLHTNGGGWHYLLFLSRLEHLNISLPYIEMKCSFIIYRLRKMWHFEVRET